MIIIIIIIIIMIIIIIIIIIIINGWLSDIWRMIEAESEIVNISIDDVEENQVDSDIVRTSMCRLVMIRMTQ